MCARVVIGGVCLFAATLTAWGDDTERERKAAFGQLRSQLARAQRQGNEPEVVRLAEQGRQALGDLAGVPEVADEYQPAPRDVKPLSPDEARRAFELYLRRICRAKWRR